MKYLDRLKQIVEFNNSDEYRKLNKYYAQLSIFDALGVSRKEEAHSNFLAWLLNPQSNHSLGDLPLRKFLETIAYVCSVYAFAKNKLNDDYINIFLFGNYTIIDVSVEREKSIQDKGRLDIYITAKIKCNNEYIPLQLAIENKVKSNEHNEQTLLYQEWMEENSIKNSILIGIYLTPLGKYKWENLRESQCKCKKFIQLNYQILADNVIAPCKDVATSEKTYQYLDEYLHALGRPAIYQDKGDFIMAVVKDEKDLLLNFWNKHKGLLLAAMNSMINSNILEDDKDKEQLQTAYSAIEKISNRDFTKYDCVSPMGNLIGTQMGKNSLVKAVVTDYVKAHNEITFSELEKVFPKKLQVSSFGVFTRLEDTQKYKYKSYYVDEPLVISDAQIAICSLWNSNNISGFVEVAKKLGYKITP